MHDLSALPTLPRGRPRPTVQVPRGGTPEQRSVLAIETIGYLVPRADFTGRVHSVFAQACSFACDGTLLTLCGPHAAIGPLTLRLARGATQELRELFVAGERVDAGCDGLLSGRAELRWADAKVWTPAGLRALLAADEIEHRVHLAAARVAQFRSTHPSIVDGAGAPVVGALQEACRTLANAQATLHVERLIGWGEGLTPAGDDFLVGMLAGLDALARGTPRRQRFRDALAAAVVTGATRTTSISAQYLRLATGGHYTQPLLGLRDALIAEPAAEIVDGALHGALAIGATSGADTVSGLLAALAAWAVPSPAAAQA
jgi:hypothetical protein